MARDPSSIKGAGSSSFERTTPRSFRLAQGNPGAISQLNTIGERADHVKLRARSHFSKYEETWVVKEAIALWKQRSGLSAAVGSLPSIAKEYAAGSVMTEARRNVRARMTQRLTKINSAATRMSNSVIRNLQTMQRTQGPSQVRGDGGPKKGSPSR